MYREKYNEREKGVFLSFVALYNALWKTTTTKIN